jgi:ferrochelatase
VAGGVLLVNLGTPAAPTAQAVRSYLAEFLSDPRVVELPRFVWLPILHGIVLRTRPRRSAEKYAQIWTTEGSPLAVHTARQAKLLQAALPEARVEYAMRYGEPTIAAALKKLAACTDVQVLPLYPQYSRATTESVRDVLPRGMRMIDSFHDHPEYIGAVAANVRRHWEEHGRAEILLMSFHGLPKRSVERGDPYEVQCRATARLLAERLELGDPKWQLVFQSRFGGAKWLEPYALPTLVGLARAGVRTVDVVFPGFVSDCLETLEEIGIGAREAFRAAGGAQLRLIPCLNETPEWIGALASIARA